MATAALALATPAAAIERAALDAEIEAVTTAFNSGRITLGTDRLGRPTCSVDASTGEALVDDRLCRFSVDCVDANRGNAAAAAACAAARREKLVEKLARRNVSWRERHARQH